MQRLSFGTLRGVFCAWLVMLCPAGVLAQPRVLDSFDDVSSWKVVTSEAVSLKVTSEDNGRSGHCIRLDYDFTRGSGYGIIRKEFSPLVPLGENYRFSYAIRGEGPSNTVEFKLIDETGDNVWWTNQTNFQFPSEWKTVTLPKRKIVFAWGPAGADVPLKSARYLEFAITSYNGGKGTVWLDELTFEELPVSRGEREIDAVRMSSTRRSEGDQAADGKLLNWKSSPTSEDPTPSITVEFHAPTEFGGVRLDWAVPPRDFDVLTSLDAQTFSTAASVRGFSHGPCFIQIPDGVAKAIRVQCLASGTPAMGVHLRGATFMPLEFGDSPNELLKAVAKAQKRGVYPRQFLGEGVFWTIEGVNGDENEVLVGEEGTIEVTKSGFSLEAMISERTHGKSETGFYTWASTPNSRTSLVDGFLPAPVVNKSYNGLEFGVRCIVEGESGAST